ncbi:MAG: cell division protein FtsQ/DivIB [Pseudomonadota bacterium]
MPKVKPATTKGRGRRAARQPVYEPREEVRASSILFGLTMLVALVVAAAAWMGGSLSQVESRMANATDSVARSAGLAVADVKVYGLETEPELESLVRGAAMIEPGENMFRADPYQIRSRVEGTQRVLNVRVHRLWPGQVVIMADKAEAAALWRDGDRLAVIDRMGREIPARQADRGRPLVSITGEGAPEALPGLLDAFEADAALGPRIAMATRIAERRWTLRLDTGVTAELPGDEHLKDAVARLEDLDRRTALTRRSIASIDLRAPGSVFVTPGPSAQQGGAA